jgi:hypothetical protein
MLTAQEPPKWEGPRSKPRTGVREYTLEISHQTFKQLFWVAKGKNAANKDEPDRITVSGLAEMVLREWLGREWPGLELNWKACEAAEAGAIEHVAAQTKAQP